MTHHVVKRPSAKPSLVRPSVTSADGTRLPVFESGNPEGPVVVAVHGYPDNHTVWDGIAAELGERFRVLTYDVRGAGDSDKPTGRAAYRMERLTEDFRAVIDDVSPDAPVHLLAHDWGSIQSWAAVTDPSFADRIASYTSISGPCLHYVGAWMRDRSHPGGSLRQAVKSWYIAVFQIPRLPERVVRLDAVDRGLARTELKGSPVGVLRNPVQRSEADKVNGINLYRANMVQILFRPRPVRTAVPVQVIAPVEDAFVSVRLATETPAPYVDALTVREVAGNHWVVSERPDVIAAHVEQFAVQHGAGAPAPTKGAGKRARR